MSACPAASTAASWPTLRGVTRPELKVLFITGYAENAIIGNGQLAPGMRRADKAVRDGNAGRRIVEMTGDDSKAFERSVTGSRAKTRLKS